MLLPSTYQDAALLYVKAEADFRVRASRLVRASSLASISFLNRACATTLCVFQQWTYEKYDPKHLNQVCGNFIHLTREFYAIG